MIGTKSVRVTAGRPDCPLGKVSVIQGGALTIGVLDVPKARFGIKVESCSVSIENAGSVVATVSAKAEGNVWTATFPATHFAAAGEVAGGITVTASGKDENGVACAWKLGIGDLEVVSAEATPEPGEVVERITTKTFDGETISLDTEDDIYNGLKKILVKLGATVACLAACAVANALPPPGYTNNTYSADGVTWTRHGALNTRTAYVVTDTSAGGGAGAPGYAAVSNAAMSAVQRVNGFTGTNITLDAAAVGARPSSWLPTPAQIGAATPADATNAASAVVLQNVPAWARSADKPTYTATEVGALPTTGGTVSGELTVYGDLYAINPSFNGEVTIRSGWSSIQDSFSQTLPNYLASGEWNTASDPFAKMSQLPSVAGLTTSNEVESIVASHPRLVALTGDVVTATNLPEAVGAETRLTTTAFVSTAIDGVSATIGYTNAVLPSASASTLALDRSVQYVELSGNTTLTIAAPSRTFNAARDFVVYVNTTGTNALNLAALNGVLAVDEAYTNAVEPGVTMIMFTEITNGVWAIGRQALKPLK